MAESFMSKLHTLVMAHAHQAVDEAIDMDSIPVLTQKVREFEQNIDTTKHLAAVAAANITTLNTQQDALQKLIDDGKARAKAWKDKGDAISLGYAKDEVTKVIAHQAELVALQAQIDVAKKNSTALDSAKDKMVAQHQEVFSRLQILKSKSASADAITKANANLKQIKNFSSNGIDGQSVDNIAQRIEARSDVANEEFNRTIADLSSPPDPLKDKAADDMLASL